MNQPGERIAGPKENIRATRILCTALVTGIVVFAIVVILLINRSGPLLNRERGVDKRVFIYVSAGLALVCLLWAIPSYQKKMMGIKNSTVSLVDKLNQYRTTLISYLAPCEGAALFSVVVLFLTGDLRVLLITVSMLLAMLSKFPFPKRMIHELNLDWKEQAELTGPIT